MAIVNVRSLPEDIYTKLRMRATLSGRSIETEARAIIITAINGNAVEIVVVSNKTFADQRVREYRALMKQLRHINLGRTFKRDESNERI